MVVSGGKCVLEYLDHLHKHYLHPSRLDKGQSVTPMSLGYSVEMKAASMDKFEF
jgi:L-galactonate dehydratase